MSLRLPPQWWQRGVLYQIYPRSFLDTNGDGIGDLEGIIDRLDHLAWLGVAGLWLSPISPSPNADWGYDVADYTGVDPAYGDLETLDRLVGAAADRDIGVLLDLVPNHTSNRHPWFLTSASSRQADRRDWYVWADPKPDGSPPNNWVAQFGGPAWTLDPDSGQYFLHNFTPEQPDLNWWSDDVRYAFEHILDFWWSHDIAGFRIDVCNIVIKDRQLRDNPSADDTDSIVEQIFGQRYVYNVNRPEVHDVIRSWRRSADAVSPPRILIGETDVTPLSRLVDFYGDPQPDVEPPTGDQLHLAFNFEFLHADFSADQLRAVVEATEAALPAHAWPVWTGSNHDYSRLATRWASGDPDRIRTALFILLSLRGTPVLYQGDELGLPDGDITKDDLRDPVGLAYWPHMKGRDPERTPYPWDESPTVRGFTRPGIVPWLPVSTPAGCSLAVQHDDPHSVVSFVRRLIELRREYPDLAAAPYATVPSPPGTWTYSRGDHLLALVNMADDTVAFDPPHDRTAEWVVLAATRPDLDDSPAFLDGPFHLGSMSAALLGCP